MDCEILTTQVIVYKIITWLYKQWSQYKSVSFFLILSCSELKTSSGDLLYVTLPTDRYLIQL